MISHDPTTTIPGSTTLHDRGLVSEEMSVVSGTGTLPKDLIYRPFWRPILGSSLFILSTCVLSWFLMLGFHVGVNSDGVIDLGAGAALWLCITSIIAFYVGGLMLNMISTPSTTGWIKGVALWGLTIPLALVIYGIASRGGALDSLYLPRSGALDNLRLPGSVATVSTLIGFAWTAFIALGLGLVTCVLGSIGCLPRGKM